VLGQLQQRQHFDADDAFLPPHLRNRSSMHTMPDVSPEGEGLPSGWGQQDTQGAAGDGGGGGVGVPGVGQGIGPSSFGLRFEAPPVLPDEPVRLVHVPENPSDSYLL
jgi:hypothetical protein